MDKILKQIGYVIEKPDLKNTLAGVEASVSRTWPFNPSTKSSAKENAIRSAKYSWKGLHIEPPVLTFDNKPFALRIFAKGGRVYNTNHMKEVVCLDDKGRLHNVALPHFVEAALHGVSDDGVFKSLFVWAYCSSRLSLIPVLGSTHKKIVDLHNKLESNDRVTAKNTVPGDVFICNDKSVTTYVGRAKYHGELFHVFINGLVSATTLDPKASEHTLLSDHLLYGQLKQQVDAAVGLQAKLKVLGDTPMPSYTRHAVFMKGFSKMYLRKIGTIDDPRKTFKNLVTSANGTYMLSIKNTYPLARIAEKFLKATPGGLQYGNMQTYSTSPTQVFDEFMKDVEWVTK